MQTIVISVQTRDVDLVAREPLVITINEGVRDLPRPRETNGAGASNEVGSPLWTWFIENPRPNARGQFRQAWTCTRTSVSAVCGKMPAFGKFFVSL